ncbi:hypothetical protein PF005_g13705 [Phytophthora fragariae]|uniref:Uncharacterized protein n=1 Tax=Phytophthora fragariae TaxID=53985 RepID=A0A6A3TTV8_9STRA|nr:hypothetical protein PF003_g18956 [Phytophthora fragariae]KAE8935415.1 hypothetical protein PF009_g14638 [Phytophthora fragariae]KAE9004733.1 hypothetical protein PF011_g12331 [Phytophthora fragariae]KAE9105330.1 hypothetical protein PF007_g13740 [Phytophthora fragariae]KAE9105776.1 hypothetical protein PF010_g12867 [Phytophthora fragariae]
MSSGASIKAALSAAASDSASALQGQVATTSPEAAKHDTVPDELLNSSLSLPSYPLHF